VTTKGYGHGDPVWGRHLLALHDSAVQIARAMYLDPETGLWVQTSETLAKNGACCGKCCRHCPYDRAAQQAAGRAILRP